MDCMFEITMNIKYQSYESSGDFFNFLNLLCNEKVIDIFSQHISDSEGYHRQYKIDFSLKDDLMNVALYEFIEKIKRYDQNIPSNNLAYILLMTLLISASNSGGESKASFSSRFTYGDAKMVKIGIKEEDLFYRPYITIKSSLSVIDRIESFLRSTIKYSTPKVLADIDDSDEVDARITIYPDKLSYSNTYPIYFISEFLKDLKRVEDTLYWKMACDNMIKKFNDKDGTLNYSDSIIDISSHISYGRREDFPM